MGDELGFIGIGRMGGPMAANLAKAGMKVAVCDTNAWAMELATSVAGISAMSKPADVAASSEVLFTCLPNNEIVRAVYLGENGITEAAKAGLITCDCSTVSPDVTTELHGVLGKLGIQHMDTPMLGSTPQAESGEIFFIVGGDAENLPRITPYLEIMGKMHRYVGPSGAGNWIKLVHNALGAVNAVAVAEALALCAKAGVDIEHFYQVVKNGGGMALSTYFDRRVQRIAQCDFSPTFTLELMSKDVDLALKLAHKLDVPTPIIEETGRTYQEGLVSGWGQEDFSAVTHVIEKRIGGTISGKQ